MDELIREQARVVNSAIHMLQKHVLVRNVATNLERGSKAKELTITQMSTLLVVQDRGAISIKELAEATRVSPPSASSMVERLVEMGVLTREPSPTDRREVRISLSSDGEAAVDTMESQIHGAVIEILEKLGPEYAAKWCDVYEHILECLPNMNASAKDDAVGNRLVEGAK